LIRPCEISDSRTLSVAPIWRADEDRRMGGSKT
jgi:hypothetical protein